MGNTLRNHDNLIHVRGWTREQIGKVFDTLRRKKVVYWLSKDDFTRYFGGRNREVITVFNDLDTDFDGKVDIFEILVVLALWSGTSWEEKQEMLFESFDMMNKGFLKIDEVVLMGTVLVNVLKKFVKLDSKWDDARSVSSLAQRAVPANEGKILLPDFRGWTNGCQPFTQLRGFIEDNSARSQAETNETRMRVRISAIERHAQRLFERVERLQDRLPDFADACIDYVSAWGRRKRWDFLMQNMRQLVLKLQQLSESMHSTLVDLESSLNEEEASGGMSHVIDPHKRFKQEQMLMSLDGMRSTSKTDFREATDLLLRLVELTEPNEMQAAMSVENETAGTSATDSLNVINEDEFEGLIDMSPPRVVENRNAMKQVHAEMLSDTEDGGYFGRVVVEADAAAAEAEGTKSQQGPVPALVSADAGGSARGLAIEGALAIPGLESDGISRGVDFAKDPQLVAIADFLPPPSHQAQMLKLYVGDVVTVLGQDGRGWWYGSKQNGKEGWFPPSYVQVKAAHFSSAAAQAPAAPAA